MANSRLLLLRPSCNNKSLMSSVGSSSVFIRCSTTPAKCLGFNIAGSDQKIINIGDHDQRKSNRLYLNKNSTSTVKASVAAAAASGSVVTTAATATPPRNDEEVRGGMFTSLMDLFSTSSSNHALLLLIMLRKMADLISQRKYYFQKMQLQMFFERVIIDCRFFTLFAVAGSLLASVLCFVEGGLVVLKSYIHYFHTLSAKADQGIVMQLLIEAIDTFLLGTAMFMFGVGLYTMFVGSKSAKEKGLAGSNLFGIATQSAMTSSSTYSSKVSSSSSLIKSSPTGDLSFIIASTSEVTTLDDPSSRFNTNESISGSSTTNSIFVDSVS